MSFQRINEKHFVVKYIVMNYIFQNENIFVDQIGIDVDHCFKLSNFWKSNVKLVKRCQPFSNVLNDFENELSDFIII